MAWHPTKYSLAVHLLWRGCGGCYLGVPALRALGVAKPGIYGHAQEWMEAFYTCTGILLMVQVQP